MTPHPCKLSPPGDGKHQEGPEPGTSRVSPAGQAHQECCDLCPIMGSTSASFLVTFPFDTWSAYPSPSIAGPLPGLQPL